MKHIEVHVSGTRANVKVFEPLTSGTVGLPVRLFFDNSWDGLVKSVTFKAGRIERSRAGIDEETTVPWEVMTAKNCVLQIGVKGSDHSNNTVIPTIWADADVIQPGATVSAEEEKPATPTVSEQALQIAIEARECANSILVKKTNDDGIVISDLENNHAIGQDSIAAGADLVAGLRGYYIKAVNFDTNVVYLSAELVAPTVTSEDLTDATFETPAYAAGDMISIIKEGNSHWLLCGEIVSIEHNKVVCSELPFTEIDGDFYYSFSVRDKPLVGALPLTYAVFVAGGNNIMAGKYGFGGGCGNRGYGDYSFFAGKDNQVGYCAGSLGKSNVVMGYMAFAIGWENEASAEASCAGGYRTAARARAAVSLGIGTVAEAEAALSLGHNTYASGKDSVAEGINTNANGIASHAEGQKTIAGCRGFSVLKAAEDNENEGCGWYTLDTADGVEIGQYFSLYLCEGPDDEYTPTFKQHQGIILSIDKQNAKIYVNNFLFDARLYNCCSDLRLSDASKNALPLLGSKPVNYYQHAEGRYTMATGMAAHAEGHGTAAFGHNSHAEGKWTKAHGLAAHAEGQGIEDSNGGVIYTEALANGTHAEGRATRAEGLASHSEGYKTAAKGKYSHAEGRETTADGEVSHSEGYKTAAKGKYSHTEGQQTTASGEQSHAEGFKTAAKGMYSHAEGEGATAEGQSAHAEGQQTTASGNQAHAEGRGSVASGAGAHAEGCSRTSGSATVGNTASGAGSHAEGRGTTASGNGSHTEGSLTEASGAYSHAEGLLTAAQAEASHAEGKGTIANVMGQHVVGRYNVANNQMAEIVGNGTGDSSRSNIRTLDWNGNAKYAGKVTAGKDPTAAMDLVTLQYLNNIVGDIETALDNIITIQESYIGGETA